MSRLDLEIKLNDCAYFLYQWIDKPENQERLAQAIKEGFDKYTQERNSFVSVNKATEHPAELIGKLNDFFAKAKNQLTANSVAFFADRSVIDSHSAKEFFLTIEEHEGTWLLSSITFTSLKVRIMESVLMAYVKKYCDKSTKIAHAEQQSADSDFVCIPEVEGKLDNNWLQSLSGAAESPASEIESKEKDLIRMILSKEQINLASIAEQAQTLYLKLLTINQTVKNKLLSAQDTAAQTETLTL